MSFHKMRVHVITAERYTACIDDIPVCVEHGTIMQLVHEPIVYDIQYIMLPEQVLFATSTFTSALHKHKENVYHTCVQTLNRYQDNTNYCQHFI